VILTELFDAEFFLKVVFGVVVLYVLPLAALVWAWEKDK
jgi:hypothetical protein